MYVMHQTLPLLEPSSYSQGRTSSILSSCGHLIFPHWDTNGLTKAHSVVVKSGARREIADPSTGVLVEPDLQELAALLLVRSVVASLGPIVAVWVGPIVQVKVRPVVEVRPVVKVSSVVKVGVRPIEVRSFVEPAHSLEQAEELEGTAPARSVQGAGAVAGPMGPIVGPIVRQLVHSRAAPEPLPEEGKQATPGANRVNDRALLRPVSMPPRPVAPAEVSVVGPVEAPTWECERRVPVAPGPVAPGVVTVAVDAGECAIPQALQARVDPAVPGAVHSDVPPPIRIDSRPTEAPTRGGVRGHSVTVLTICERHTSAEGRGKKGRERTTRRAHSG